MVAIREGRRRVPNQAEPNGSGSWDVVGEHPAREHDEAKHEQIRWRMAKDPSTYVTGMLEGKGNGCARESKGLGSKWRGA